VTVTEPTPTRVTPAGQLVTAVLGDYWFSCHDHIPTAALVAILGEFGVGDQAVRAALSRLQREGGLEGVKVGRHTGYRLAPARRDVAMAAGREIMRFGLDPVPWDGSWTCVTFSIPESDRRRRSALRSRLRALGLGALFDGVWVTPHAPLRRIDRCLADLAIDGAGVFRLTEVKRADGVRMLDAWDLDDLAARYQAVEARAAGLAESAAAGSLGAADALRRRTWLLDAWRALVRTDPRLPDQLLPAGWPLGATRRAFVEAYDALGPLAEERVWQLTRAGGPIPTPAPAHHRVADLL
jgi:phenylacetic acid degradation operon negative regulatory protein